MKKISLFLPLICSLCLGTLVAQESNSAETVYVKSSREAKKSFVLGVRAGINRSNVYDEQGMDFVADPKTGFAGGVYAAIPLGSLIGLQPEILFSQKGFKSTGRIANDAYKLERTTNYIDIPLQLQVKPFRFFTLLGGVQYSYLVSQSDRITYGLNSAEQQQEFDNDNIRKNILGIVTGFDINISHLVFSGRASWDLRANRGDGSSFTPRYKNLLLQATFGFRFY